MQTLIDSFIERDQIENLTTGEIVIISGDYLPVDNYDHDMMQYPTFLSSGEQAPILDDTDTSTYRWRLSEMFDFASA